MAAKKKDDLGDYTEIFGWVDPARQTVAKKYIGELLFMEKQLEALKRDIKKNGAVDNFRQGSQSMLRESPAMKSYCTLVKRYGDLQKKLADLLPEKKDAEKAQAGEKLAAFVAKGKG